MQLEFDDKESLISLSPGSYTLTDPDKTITVAGA